MSDAACSGGGSAASSFRDGRVDALASERRHLGADASVQEKHTVDPRDRRPLLHPARVFSLGAERLTQFDHSERDFLEELLPVRRRIVLASLGLGPLRRLLVQRRQNLVTKLG